MRWGRRPRPVPAEAVVDAIRTLAAALRSGLPPAAALAAWPAAAAPALEPALRRVARRVSLGMPPRLAVAVAAPELGPVARGVARAFALQRDAGGSLPAMLDGVADSVALGEATRRGAAAASSGARLSARLVAGLPLLFVPLTSGGTLPRAGVAGIALLSLGVGLGAAGLWWIDRLVPRPRGDDGAAVLADDLAVALAGGVALLPALDALASTPPRGLEEALARARRRARLGERWVDALRREDAGLAGVAGVLARSAARGVPAAAPLREWARARRAQVEDDHRRSLQRAPVLMVVPLTVCVLPSFALLAFGPLLLGAMQGA